MNTITISLRISILGLVLIFSNSASAVRNGTAVGNSDQFAPVGMLWQPSDISFGSCSGTLITPRHVLTAAHCYIGNSITNPQRFAFAVVRQEARLSHIELLKKGQWKDYDLAILTLDREIKNVELPVLEFDYLDENAEITPLAVVGFGISYDGDHFGTKRAGLVLPALVFRAAANENFQGQKHILSVIAADENNQIGCPGDSGGAVFRKRPDGKLGLVGVNHGSPVSDRSRPCDSAEELFVIPVAEHADWIKENIK